MPLVLRAIMMRLKPSNSKTLQDLNPKTLQPHTLHPNCCQSLTAHVLGLARHHDAAEAIQLQNPPRP